MRNVDHCKICENKKVEFGKGFYCSLTNEKPNFQNKCEVIKFGKTLEEEIVSKNYAFEGLNQFKTTQRASFIGATIIGILISIVGWYLTIYIYEIGYYSTITLFFICLAIFVLGRSLSQMMAFKRKTNTALEQIDELQEVLDVYNIQYDIDIKVKKVHGIKEYDYDLKTNVL